ncbi:uncharacterized protein LOC117643940 [Thrips palmi]|uniref:Uncharacterized protein LOC117643940 n=1 Tax=Thrips palmi TaxID=161013 RepID=A0A6P8YGZ0_THRPL|nr:uncharacterized protein LOC117643940 [Thrips palmi]
MPSWGSVFPLIVTAVFHFAANADGVGAAPALPPAVGLHGLRAAGKDHNSAQYYYSLDPQHGAYSFAYDTGSTGHQSFREETRTEDGGVRGSFGYVDSGVLRVTEYTADQRGYRCHQTVRYLVEPGRGTFVPAEKPDVNKASLEPERLPISSGQWNLQMQSQSQEKNLRHRSATVERDNSDWETSRRAKQNRQSWSKTRLAQPARVLGKKVMGHYKDFTSEPAVGGTAAVTAWDSAHHSELRDEEIFGWQQQHRQTDSTPAVGGTLVWPVTEDGMRVVWQPF